VEGVIYGLARLDVLSWRYFFSGGCLDRRGMEARVLDIYQQKMYFPDVITPEWLVIGGSTLNVLRWALERVNSREVSLVWNVEEFLRGINEEVALDLERRLILSEHRGASRAEFTAPPTTEEGIVGWTLRELRRLRFYRWMYQDGRLVP